MLSVQWMEQIGLLAMPAFRTTTRTACADGPWPARLSICDLGVSALDRQSPSDPTGGPFHRRLRSFSADCELRDYWDRNSSRIAAQCRE
jgi:hypothetical protein